MAINDKSLNDSILVDRGELLHFATRLVVAADEIPVCALDSREGEYAELSRRECLAVARWLLATGVHSAAAPPTDPHPDDSEWIAEATGPDEGGS